jgi:quercetin dioxygenase-like cupin family protein
MLGLRNQSAPTRLAGLTLATLAAPPAPPVAAARRHCFGFAREEDTMTRSAGRILMTVAVAMTFAAAAASPGSAVRGAQDGAPAGEPAALPEGVTVAPLLVEPLTALPPAPAYVGLARLTYPPGAAVASQVVAGTTLLYVESGSIVAEVGGAAVTGSAGPVGTAAASPAAGGGTPVEAGRPIVVPADTPFATRNDGPQPAIVFQVEIYASATPPPLGASLSFLRLGSGVATALPAAPVQVGLGRVTLDAGASTDLAEVPGPVLVVVEFGTLSLVTPGSEATLGLGGTAFIQGGTQSAARNAGSGPLVLLVLAVFPAAAGDGATPAA